MCRAEVRNLYAGTDASKPNIGPPHGECQTRHTRIASPFPRRWATPALGHTCHEMPEVVASGREAKHPDGSVRTRSPRCFGRRAYREIPKGPLRRSQHEFEIGAGRLVLEQVTEASTKSDSQDLWRLNREEMAACQWPRPSAHNDCRSQGQCLTMERASSEARGHRPSHAGLPGTRSSRERSARRSATCPTRVRDNANCKTRSA